MAEHPTPDWKLPLVVFEDDSTLEWDVYDSNGSCVTDGHHEEVARALADSVNACAAAGGPENVAAMVKRLREGRDAVRHKIDLEVMLVSHHGEWPWWDEWATYASDILATIPPSVPGDGGADHPPAPPSSDLVSTDA
jgi:hypothetical protein